jgi:hypothetical protein
LQCPFPRDTIVEGIRAIRAKINGREIWSVIHSRDAVIIGGNESNPCIDMAIGFGNLEPGEVATAKVQLHLFEGSQEDILKRII